MAVGLAPALASPSSHLTGKWNGLQPDPLLSAPVSSRQWPFVPTSASPEESRLTSWKELCL